MHVVGFTILCGLSNKCIQHGILRAFSFSLRQLPGSHPAAEAERHQHEGEDGSHFYFDFHLFHAVLRVDGGHCRPVIVRASPRHDNAARAVPVLRADAWAIVERQAVVAAWDCAE
jgi:hypothetical protein